MKTQHLPDGRRLLRQRKRAALEAAGPNVRKQASSRTGPAPREAWDTLLKPGLGGGGLAGGYLVVKPWLLGLNWAQPKEATRYPFYVGPLPAERNFGTECNTSWVAGDSFLVETLWLAPHPASSNQASSQLQTHLTTLPGSSSAATCLPALNQTPLSLRDPSASSILDTTLPLGLKPTIHHSQKSPQDGPHKVKPQHLHSELLLLFLLSITLITSLQIKL
ncbi:hypothetical protein CHARACLAT_021063, partial [Characodon lateralis]|nr:hypothetical protein [Characodon lateralis]